MENRESVKVVLIDTRYVKTDATMFKSVVQSLTGKDSSVAWIDKDGAFAGVNDGTAKRKRLPSHDVRTVDSSNGRLGNIPVLSKGLSFKDFDRMLLEMPPLEELQYWLSDDFMMSKY